MKAFVVGFPKAGTGTLHKAFQKSGLRSAHWKVPEGFCGELIYRADRSGRDPLWLLRGYDCIAEAEVCMPSRRINFWPNLDFPLLGRIRSFHPECTFLLNYRDPARIAASIRGWADMSARLTRSEIPGLPAGIGAEPGELEDWIQNHFDACRKRFAEDPRFLELDIESRNAAEILSSALETPIRGWGVSNAGSRQKVQRKPGKITDTARTSRIAGRWVRRLTYRALSPIGLIRRLFGSSRPP